MKPPAISCSMPFLSAQSSAISRGKLGSRFLFFSHLLKARASFPHPFYFSRLATDISGAGPPACQGTFTAWVVGQ